MPLTELTDFPQIYINGVPDVQSSGKFISALYIIHRPPKAYYNELTIIINLTVNGVIPVIDFRRYC